MTTSPLSLAPRPLGPAIPFTKPPGALEGRKRPAQKVHFQQWPRSRRCDAHDDATWKGVERVAREPSELAPIVPARL